MYKNLIRPLLFRFSSDYAHEATVKFASACSKNSWLLKTAGAIYNDSDPSLSQNLLGLNFPNPVGLAAGFDKNGTMIPLMEKLGFGFVEVGSITANPSAGNPKPRSFRLLQDQSLINRMGLNNDGAQTISRRLQKLSPGIPMGINIAKTHDPSIYGEKAVTDYKISFDLVKKTADYITINISCPNTEEGKTFEDPETLDVLLKALDISKDASLPPVLVKFSADLDDSQLSELIGICENHTIKGYVATNTSSTRYNLTAPASKLSSIGKGGLSGRAITERSTKIIEKISTETKGKKVIIGVGGILNGEDAIEKLKAGADLLQVYTGLIYEGPSLVNKIKKEISGYLKKRGLSHVYHIKKVTDR